MNGGGGGGGARLRARTFPRVRIEQHSGVLVIPGPYDASLVLQYESSTRRYASEFRVYGRFGSGRLRSITVPQSLQAFAWCAQAVRPHLRHFLRSFFAKTAS